MNADGRPAQAPRAHAEALPLVLLPGTLCDARVWAPMLQCWPGGAPPTITPTLAGQQSAAAMARALLKVLPPRFALMGFSLGGIVALEMAAQAPERVGGMALVAANARPDPPENAAQREAGVAAARADMAGHLRRDLWPRYVAPARLGDAAMADAVLRMALAAGPAVYADQAAIANHRADSRPRLAALRMPVLIASGDEDLINPPDRQAEIAQAVSQARWVRFQGVGHFVPLETPEALAEAAGRWWAQSLLQA
ncbi:alpha/beta fold hydrolase [Hydrogenophaga sp. BPS33]|uniref:alpha/beta fold hydrolase n=1 Tax=Hydrogenophaga sp. BPS33 TaxID=2651974 RepID=UPI0013202097|nr:alpha/beta fold hydrolase [Hydrogenophaga sp. BPS33]QHE88587.1 alpha/beta hydrolase [Hydrogenophaga sp. BPS33]